MPIIQGALAAGSSGRSQQHPQLSEERRVTDIRRIRKVHKMYWSDYAPANVDREIPDLHISPPIGVCATEEVVAEEPEEPPRPCCCGLISDEKQFRANVTEFFEEPSSTAANWVSIVITVCIIISTFTIILESLPELNPDIYETPELIFFVIECACITVFTLEYVIKFAVAQPKWRYVIAGMNLVDLLAILPFYIDLLFRALGIASGNLDILRLLRLARIFKLLKKSPGILVCGEAIMESKETLGLMVFMLSIVVITFGSFEHFCEGGEWNRETRLFEYSDDDGGGPTLFVSIPAAMWWTIVTVMTVGYGDVYPITFWGKLIAALSMISALVIMALPISVIGANFSRAWAENKTANTDADDMAQRLERSFEAVMDSIYRQNSMMEEIMSDGCEELEVLHKELRRAQRAYERLRPSSDVAKLTSTNLDEFNSEELKRSFETVVRIERKLQYCLQKLLVVGNGSLRTDSSSTLLKGKLLENYILRNQEISANTIGLEAVVLLSEDN